MRIAAFFCTQKPQIWIPEIEYWYPQLPYSGAFDRMKLHLKKDKIRSKYIVFRRFITSVIYCSMLDSSCGDMTWMPSFLSSRSDVEYTGYDIVEANINNHREKFKDTDLKFEVHDILIDPINR